MSGGSFDYAFRKDNLWDWWSPVYAIEDAALRAAMGWNLRRHGDESEFLTPTIRKGMLEFCSEFRKAVGTEYNPEKPDRKDLFPMSEEAREVIKAVEWVHSCDSGWTRMVEAILGWQASRREGWRCSSCHHECGVRR